MNVRMGIATKKYIRKPLYVEAVRVTTDNFEQIRDWVSGEIKLEDTPREGQTVRKHYVKFDAHMPKTPRQKRAYVGDWMLQTEQGFKVYTTRAFHAAFDLVEAVEEAVAHKIPPFYIDPATGYLTETAPHEGAVPMNISDLVNIIQTEIRSEEHHSRRENPAQAQIEGLPPQEPVDLGEDEMIAAGAIKEVDGHPVDPIDDPDKAGVPAGTPRDNSDNPVGAAKEMVIDQKNLDPVYDVAADVHSQMTEAFVEQSGPTFKMVGDEAVEVKPGMSVGAAPPQYEPPKVESPPVSIAGVPATPENIARAVRENEEARAVDAGRTRTDEQVAEAMLKDPKGRTRLGLDPAVPNAKPVFSQGGGGPVDLSDDVREAVAAQKAEETGEAQVVESSTSPPVPPPSTVPPVQEKAQRVLGTAEQEFLGPEKVRELLQSGEAVLVQDIQ